MKWKVSFHLDAADDDTGIVEVKDVRIVKEDDDPSLIYNIPSDD